MYALGKATQMVSVRKHITYIAKALIKLFLIDAVSHKGSDPMSRALKLNSGTQIASSTM